MSLPRHKQIILLSLGFFLVMMLIAVFHEEGIYEVYKFENELGELNDRIATLREENRRTREEISALRSDPFAIEKIAREKLRLARPDETVYVIVPPGRQPP